ncbi:TlpA family protein disulfide reductase [Winogradskyella costae]|uniref:TlpA family protein disulfide reductase n=1 Tax=Winogradskyella costae TaxID=2697008 RepID=UPI0015CBD2C9|nr:redoxin domain-containing protein [Winogradskyella costae]
MTHSIPHINVLDLDGVPVDLMPLYKDKILLLIIYNNDCLGCTGRAIPLAYEFQQEFPSIHVVGIHADFIGRTGDKATIKAIFTSGELPFPIYIDRDHQVYDQFASEGTPQWVLLAADGTIFRSVFGSQANAKNRLYYALESLITNDTPT